MYRRDEAPRNDLEVKAVYHVGAGAGPGGGLFAATIGSSGSDKNGIRNVLNENFHLNSEISHKNIFQS